MSKGIGAVCERGIVKIEGHEVDATILTQGTRASSGMVLIQESKLFYITSNVDDLKDLIDAVISVASNVIPIAVAVSPIVLAPQIAALTALEAQLSAMKANLQ